MSDYGADNNGGSAPASRAPSPTPSQKLRNEEKAAENARIKAEDFQKVKDRGWVEGSAVDYEAKTADGEWLGCGGKYEWTEDFGDVAPDVPELEVQLFSSGHQVRSGAHLDVLRVPVTVEGPHEIAPIYNVSTPSPPPPLHLTSTSTTIHHYHIQSLTVSSSRMLAFTLSFLRM